MKSPTSGRFRRLVRGCDSVLINKAQMKIPYEILYNHKPSVAHFRIFGCPYTLLHLDANPKFKSMADDFHFMGYGARTAYCVYNKTTKQIVESFDVHWLEGNETDARVSPDWLFDYASLFKSFNVFHMMCEVLAQVRRLLLQMKRKMLCTDHLWCLLRLLWWMKLFQVLLQVL